MSIPDGISEHAVRYLHRGVILFEGSITHSDGESGHDILEGNDPFLIPDDVHLEEIRMEVLVDGEWVPVEAEIHEVGEDGVE